MSIQNKPLFDDRGRVIIQAYDQKRPFSSFLAGIGGLFGIPIWAFYNNRAQAISSFGIESKDHPILEFQPANKAYALTASTGFRTFLRTDQWTYEPFSPWVNDICQRDMHIGMNELEVIERNPARGLETSVLYFNIVNECFAALARKLTIRNIGKQPLQVEVLDGLPAVIPYGVNNDMLKSISRTIEAWMRVSNVENRSPFFTLKMTAEDTSEINTIEGGNFALGFSGGRLLPSFVDPVVLFGNDTNFTFPSQWKDGFNELNLSHQVCEGRTPCCFFNHDMSIGSEAESSMASVYGYAQDFSELERMSPEILKVGFLEKKRDEAQELVNDLAEPAKVQTGNPVFDVYAQQTFLDNILRGGWPEIVGDNAIYHVYSRKHGDPERDYNYFYLAPENYSQGNGNFRDVCQNRRDEVFFNPLTGDFNIRLFMSLIQLDGYNPLVVKGTKFSVTPNVRRNILDHVEKHEAFEKKLSSAFSPGELIRVAKACELEISAKELVDLVISRAEQHIQAEHGEGFWVDHWTYILDLIESYLAIFPDKKEELLFDSEPLPFFDNPHFVNSRDSKYILLNGKPRQQHAIGFSEEKQSKINAREDQRDWARTEFGAGEVFRVSLISKLVILAVNKFSTLDPYGMGIEMEAGRPGWCDALNGLPGIFGSSLPETFELIRLIDFVYQSSIKFPHSVELPVEVDELLQAILIQLQDYKTEFGYWDAVSAAREAYRKKTQMGVSGNLFEYSAADLQAILITFRRKLSRGINKAIEENGGIPPTYFYYDLVDYEPTGNKDDQGNETISPREFKQNTLPLYLEGPVRYMKLLEEKSEAKEIYSRVRQSALYDRKLKMYRLNDSLINETFEIGRAKAFSPGWLENESIWLHMSFKYLLELLKAGLYDEFFKEMLSNMPPYMDSSIYGRSLTENSSFLVSSAHPDPSIHGAGFVARLSGSTAEFLSMMLLFLVGPNPFIVDEQKDLILAFKPALPGDFFDEEGTLSFKFLGQCDVTYINPKRKDTYSSETQIEKIILYLPGGFKFALDDGVIPAPYSKMVRDGEINKIKVFIR
ncbi:cellobiose phosphorylase [Chloroflexota bacterium]|nr:cellobiose phosphorylase [Chloroflexota bacterium]